MPNHMIENIIRHNLNNIYGNRINNITIKIEKRPKQEGILDKIWEFIKSPFSNNKSNNNRPVIEVKMEAKFDVDWPEEWKKYSYRAPLLYKGLNVLLIDLGNISEWFGL